MRRARTLMTTIMAVLIIAATCAVATAATHTGTVVEAVTGGGYTYMNIKEGGNNFWIAGPESAIAKGTSVSFSEQVWMQNFTSQALGRTFPKILFVSGVQAAAPAAKAAPAVKAAPAIKAAPAASAQKSPAQGFAKAYTIGEILSKKAELNGRQISVKGTVVKVSRNIMGRTWVHMEDGSGEGERLVFRSINDTAEVDSVITATGRLETDMDFGFGYFYPVIVEDAVFSK